MGILSSIGNSFSKAYHWLVQDQDEPGAPERPDYVPPVDDDEDKSKQKDLADNYNPWEEIDNFRLNFFIGGWAGRKFKRITDGGLIKEREEVKKKRAEAEGREYVSPLQRDLEAAAKKREEKERRKEEKRRQKEARKQGN